MKLVANQHIETLPQDVSVTKMADIFSDGLIEKDIEEGGNQTPPTAMAKNKRKIHGFIARGNRLDRWKEDKRAGQFPKELNKPYIDKQASLSWLKRGKLGFDGERMLIGAQDQALYTNGFRKMIGKTDNDRCRFCLTESESVNHLVSGCQTLLADGHYTHRHNMVCRYLHWKICNAIGMQTKAIHDHEPERTTSHEDFVIFYDKPIPAGRFIEGGAIKPDIVVWNRKEKSAQIIEVTVPSDFGLNRAEREKNNKYQDLKNDMRRTYGLSEIELIPVVIGATGLVKNNLKGHLQAIIGQPNPEEVQLAAIKGTIRILKRALSHQV